MREAIESLAEMPRELAITTRNIEPDQVQVTVEDSGTGLDPEKIARIFEPAAAGLMEKAAEEGRLG
ncbi:MAG: hypothetical protein JO336_05225 [Acidobacteriia bacterium]|nr:hypothetical protein [Terriglobia bacterium]